MSLLNVNQPKALVVSEGYPADRSTSVREENGWAAAGEPREVRLREMRRESIYDIFLRGLVYSSA